MHERKLRFAMKIGGDYRVLGYHNTWPRAAKELSLDPERVFDRVCHLAARAPDAFADAASTPEVKSLERSLPARLVELISERVQRCVALLGAPSAAG